MSRNAKICFWSFSKKKISNKIEIFNLFTRAIWTKLDNLDNFDILDKKGNVHKGGHCGQIWTLWTKLDNLDKIGKFCKLDKMTILDKMLGQNWTIKRSIWFVIAIQIKIEDNNRTVTEICYTSFVIVQPLTSVNS